jgi:hypothetical protein
MIVSVLVIGLIALIIGTRLRKKNFLSSTTSFSLIIEKDIVKRTQNGLKEITITKAEITKIEKDIKGNINIHTSSKSQMIKIPHIVIKRDELESLLNEIMPIVIKTSSKKEKIIKIGSYSGIVFFLLFTITTNAKYAFILGILSILIFTISIISILFNKNVNKKIKLTLILFIFVYQTLFTKTYMAFQILFL